MTEKPKKKRVYTPEQKAAKRTYRKAHYEANREKTLARAKAHYEANREKILARQKARTEANREKELARQKAYHKANRERIRARLKAYMKQQRQHAHILSLHNTLAAIQKVAAA